MKYEYKLIRSKRRSISVSISCNNEICVHCPEEAGVERVEKFLAEKSAWIEKHLKNNARKLAEFSDITDWQRVLIRGEKYPLRFGNTSAFENGEVILKNRNNIKKFYIDLCAEEFTERFKSVSQKTALSYSSVNFKDYKSRWGCCDRQGKICFSYKIFALPVRLQNYIIVHELCHTVFFDHSKNFWNLVCRFVPDYKLLRKKLKDYDFILKLY